MPQTGGHINTDPVAGSKITAGRKSGRPRGYVEKYRPHANTRRLLEQVEEVLEEYAAYWPLTCRQIYYRLVGAHGFEKTEAAYGRLCDHLAMARRGRRIPFKAIRDDGVTTYGLDHFEDRDGLLQHVRELGENFTIDKLAQQDFHLEVWCEAAGMLPQLYRVASPFSVPVYSSGGFDSLSAKFQLAQRISRIGKPTIILHMGDCDPSGESIFSSISEDVAAFVEADRPWATVTVGFERVALTAQQVRDFKLSTAPPKLTDSRSKRWIGGTCQLEALPPDDIADVLRDAIEARFDLDQLRDDIARQADDRRTLTHLLPSPVQGENE